MKSTFDRLLRWGTEILRNLNDRSRGIIRIFKLRLKRLDDWRKSKGKDKLKRKFEITIVTISGEEEVQELLMLMMKEEYRLCIRILLRNLNQETILILFMGQLKALYLNILKAFLRMWEALSNLKAGQNLKWNESKDNWRIGEPNFKNLSNSKQKINERKKKEKELLNSNLRWKFDRILKEWSRTMTLKTIKGKIM